MTLSGLEFRLPYGGLSDSVSVHHRLILNSPSNCGKRLNSSAAGAAENVEGEQCYSAFKDSMPVRVN